MVSPETLSLAADRYVSYPAEAVQIYLLRRGADLPEAGQIRLSLPADLTVAGYTLEGKDDSPDVRIREDSAGESTLTWSWTLETAPESKPADKELIVRARVKAGTREGFLPVLATLYTADERVALRLEMQLQIKRYADSLQYLPEIYRRDDLTNRFLMLFESFRTPISRQIDTIPAYFDPFLTPKEFLPWLGSWFGLVLDEDLPEERKRRLIAQIATIYDRIGTKQALTGFLELYTGGEVEIVEHIDSNMVLGQDAHLGYQIALGSDNQPNSFDIFLKIPVSEQNDIAHRQQYQRRIESLIGGFKPAHTSFRLEIEFSAQPTAQIPA